VTLAPLKKVDVVIPIFVELYVGSSITIVVEVEDNDTLSTVLMVFV
jgi:hypothetical protein